MAIGHALNRAERRRQMRLDRSVARWRKSRTAKLQQGYKHRAKLRAGRQCECCGSVGCLDVHHIRYLSNGGGWEQSNLVVLCKPCHREVHAAGVDQALSRAATVAALRAHLVKGRIDD